MRLPPARLLPALLAAGAAVALPRGGPVALADGLPPATSEPLVQALHLPVVEATLDNGLRVVISPDHRAPVFALHLQAAGGAALDVAPPGGGPSRPGLAHLLEHLLYAGSPGAPGGAYDRLLSAAGGDNNAWTEHDGMAVHLVAPVEALDLALFLEADRMAALRREDVELRLPVEREIVDREAAIERDSPGGRDRAALRAALYPPGHPDGHGVLGDPESLAQVQVDEVLALHEALWAPESVVLSLVGDVEPQAALERVRHWFSAVPARPGATGPLPPAGTPDRGWSGGGGRYHHLDDVAATTLYAAWPAPPQDHPDSAALAMLVDLLGAERTGRLAPAVQAGRLDRAQAWLDQDRRGGRLVVQLSHRDRPARALWSELQAVLGALRQQPPDAAEVERLRDRWRSWAARALEDPQDRAETLAVCALERGQADCFAEHVQRHLQVGPEALAEAASTWLSAEPVLLSVTSPAHADRALPGSLPVEPR